MDDVRSVLPVRVVDKHEKYLGLPTKMGRSKREVFSWLRERLWDRTRGFGERFLSKAGKEILIKSVLQSIPTYVMGCFKLPEYLLPELESIIARFWWGEGQGKKIHWVNWDTLCESKREGGMSFRDLSSFIIAFLSRVLKVKYFPNSCILDSKPNSSASFTGKSISGASDMVKRGIRWRVGNGENIDMWCDNWIPRDRNLKPITPNLYDL